MPGTDFSGMIELRATLERLRFESPEPEIRTDFERLANMRSLSLHVGVQRFPITFSADTDALGLPSFRMAITLNGDDAALAVFNALAQNCVATNQFAEITPIGSVQHFSSGKFEGGILDATWSDGKKDTLSVFFHRGRGDMWALPLIKSLLDDNSAARLSDGSTR